MSRNKKRFLALFMALVMSVTLCIPKSSELSLYKAFAEDAANETPETQVMTESEDVTTADNQILESDNTENETLDIDNSSVNSGDTSNAESDDSDKSGSDFVAENNTSKIGSSDNVDEKPVDNKDEIVKEEKSENNNNGTELVISSPQKMDNLGDGTTYTTALNDIISSITATVSTDAAIGRNSKVELSMSYTIPRDKYPTAYDGSSDNIVWEYDISSYIASNPDLARILDKSDGDIKQGDNIRGKYEISGNVVKLKIYKSYIETVINDNPESINGTFKMQVELDAKNIGTADSISFQFPGMGTPQTIEFTEETNVPTSKSVTSSNYNDYSHEVLLGDSNTISYKVTINPNSYHKSKLNVYDELSSDKQNYDQDSFKVKVNYGTTYDIPKEYITFSGQSANVDLFAFLSNQNIDVANTIYELTYDTVVDSDAIGTELTNTAKSLWEDGGVSDEKSTTVIPKSELKVDKTASESGSNTIDYTITIGKTGEDLSNVKITDTMNDLQKISGTVMLNDSIEITPSSTFTDDTYSGNGSELFAYTLPAGTTGPAVIKYSVSIPTSDDDPSLSGSKSITNSVNAKGNNSEGNDSTSINHDFGVIGEGTVDKSFVEFDGNKVKWKITVTNTGNTELKNAYITENASCNSLDNQNWYRNDLISINWDSVEVKDSSDNAVDSSLYTTFSDSKKIMFKSIPANTSYNVYISYSPIDNSALVPGVTYQNQVSLNNSNDDKLSEDTDNKKYSENNISVNKTYIFDKASGEYTWTVVINDNQAELDPDSELFIYDDIPEGMEFVAGSFSMSLSGNSNGQSYSNNIVPGNEYPMPDDVILSETGELGPISVSDLVNNYTYFKYGTPKVVGISGLRTTVTYKTKITDAEKTSIASEFENSRQEVSRNYTNTFNVVTPDGNTVLATDDETATYDYKILTKTDMTEETLPEGKDNIRFKIDVNPDRLTLNSGNPLTLNDTLNTNIELVTDKEGDHAFVIKDEAGNDLIASGDATVAYNDDSRLITVTIPDRKHVIVEYSVRSRGLGNNIIIKNTAILLGTGTNYEDRTEERHNVSSHSATIGGNGLQLHKIDGNNIFIELSTAKFDLYELTLNSDNTINTRTRLAQNITGSNGYYTISNENFAEGKVFYWQEVVSPSGYALDDTPHYFVFYTEDSTKVLADNPSYQAADALDEAVSAANNITIAKIPLGAYTWTVCNTKSDLTGKINISKTFVGDENISADAKSNVTFEVSDGTNTYSFTYGELLSGTFTEAPTALNAGASISSDGSIVTISGLPLDTEYTVTESNEDISDDYTCETKVVNGAGTESTAKNGTLSATATGQSISFTNTYTKKTGTISVNKKFVSANNKKDTFYFGLFKEDGSALYVSDTSKAVKSVEVTGNADGSGTATEAVSWADVPYGTYKIYETNSAGEKITSTNGAAFVAKYEVTPGLDAGISVTLDSATKDAGTITNKERVAKVTIKKEFETGVDYPEGYMNVPFKVVVTLKDENDNALSGTVTYGDVTFTNGSSGELTITGNEGLTITDIPNGYKYEVEEQEPETEGYSIKSGTASGTIAVSGNTATITNTYSETKGSLTIKKTFADDSELKADAVTTKEKLTFNVKGTEVTNYNKTFDYKDFTSGSYTISGLTPDTYTVTENSTIEGSDFTRTTSYKVGTTENQNEAEVGVTAGETSTVDITNKYVRKTGRLEVTKQVTGDDDTSQEYEFEVTVADTAGKSFASTKEIGTALSQGPVISFDAGNKATFKLKKGETITISGLPAGAAYTVKEKAEDGNIDVSGGVVSFVRKTKAEGTISSTDVAKAEFINNFTKAEYKGKFTVSGTKALSDANITEIPQFTFTLTEVADVNGTEIPAGTTKTVSHATNEENGTFTFNVSDIPLSFGEETSLTKYFKITEDDLSESLAEDYEKDNNNKIISVKFRKPSGAGGDITGTVDPGSSEIKFTNNVKVKEGKFSVTKKLTGSDSRLKFPITVTLTYPDGKAPGQSVEDEKGEYSIAGNTFSIYGGNSNVSISGNVATISIELANNDKAEFSGIPFGTAYTVSETIPTDNESYAGFVHKSIVYGDETSSLTAGEVITVDSNPNVIVNNEYEGVRASFKIRKIDAETNNYLPGAWISLYKAGLDSATFVNRYELNKEEGIEVPNLDPRATYYIKETTVPAGYVAAEEVEVTFTYAGGGIYTPVFTPNEVDNNGVYQLKNSPTKVTVSKVDATNAEELSGAKIEIRDENGVIVDSWTSVKESPHVIEGRLEIGVKYTLIETVAPNGYDIATATSFVLGEDGKVIPGESTTKSKDGDSNALLVEDWPITGFGFSKYGNILEDCADERSEPYKPLEGVKFTATKMDSQGLPSQNEDDTFEATSNSLGNVMFNDLSEGTYIVKEVSTVEGYELSDKMYYAKVAYRSDPDKSLYEDKACTKLVEDNRIFNEIPKEDFSFTKVSEKNEAKKLAGSTYGLYKNTAAGRKLVSKRVTGADGIITFNGIFIDEEYTVTELVSPDGYYVSGNPITIKLVKGSDGVTKTVVLSDGNGTIVSDDAGNITWLEPEVTVSFAKVDPDGKAVSGAVLKVVDSDGNDVMDADGKKVTWTSGEEPHVVSGVFKAGETYSLVEVTAPSGYEIAEPVQFTIPDDAVKPDSAETISVNMTDKKITESTTETTTGKKTDTKTTEKKTGDNAPVTVMLILLIISFTMIFAILVGKRKKARN